MINFDNSAASFPKPASVSKAVYEAVSRFGGNPGRSGHKLSAAAAQKVFEVRSAAAEMFGAQVENVAFTLNCTYALNMAIKGLAKSGGNLVISDHEHNAVARPVYKLWKSRGIGFSVAATGENDDETLSNFDKLINEKTCAVVCTAASNVTGRIMPLKRLKKLCESRGVPLIADGAQGCGVLDLKVGADADIICASGHKGLYGPCATGLFITNGKYTPDTIIEGGTGATSAQLEQTGQLPEMLESGTLNTCAIIGLGEGIRFVKKQTPQRILAHERALCRQLEKELENARGVVFYEREYERVGVTAFNIGAMHSEEVAQKLADKGFALRGGLQCAAVTHTALKTKEQGVVRFSPSVFNTPQQVAALARTVRNLA